MEQQLGVLRAAVIVWLSGAVVSALLAVFISPLAWALLAGSARHIDNRLGVATTLVVVNALLAGIGVTVGVRLFGFRLSYALAVFALAAGGFAALLASRYLYSQTANDPTGIAVPALGSFLWSLRLLLSLFVPAFLINAMASAQGDDAMRPAGIEPATSRSGGARSIP